MLRCLSHLHFPVLVRKDDVSFKSWSDSKDKTPVYILDWSKKEDFHRRKHLEWNSQHWPNKNIPFTPSLPEKYERWVNGLEFCIPRHYYDEIKRTAAQAVIEWGTERSFDTMIRDICFKPAIAFTQVAFKLICDCAYDRKKNYFYRGDDKAIMSNVLLYKFWMHQTGRGLVWDHADFKRWEITTKSVNGCEFDTMIEKFLKDFREFEKENEKAYKEMTIDQPKFKTEQIKDDTLIRKKEDKSIPVTDWN